MGRISSSLRRVYDVITGTHLFSIAGSGLGSEFDVKCATRKVVVG